MKYGFTSSIKKELENKFY